MDRKFSKSQEIERLIRLSENSRGVLQQEAYVLQRRLDFPARIRSSLKTNPAGWLLGSTITGLATSFLFRKKTRIVVEKKPRGVPSTLLALTLTAVRPLAKVWLTNQVKNYLVRPQASTPPERRSGQVS